MEGIRTIEGLTTSPSSSVLKMDMKSLCIKFPTKLLIYLQNLSEGNQEMLLGEAQNDQSISISMLREEYSISLQFKVSQEECDHFPWLYIDGALQFTLETLSGGRWEPPECLIGQESPGSDVSSVLSFNTKISNESDTVAIDKPHGQCTGEKQESDDKESTGINKTVLCHPLKLEKNEVSASTSNHIQEQPEISNSSSEIVPPNPDLMVHDFTDNQDDVTKNCFLDACDNNTGIGESHNTGVMISKLCETMEDSKEGSRNLLENAHGRKTSKLNRKKNAPTRMHCLLTESQKQKQQTLDRYQQKCILCPKKFLVQSSLKHHITKKHHIYWDTYLKSVNETSEPDIVGNVTTGEGIEALSSLDFIEEGPRLPGDDNNLNVSPFENKMSSENKSALFGEKGIVETDSGVKRGRKRKAGVRGGGGKAVESKDNVKNYISCPGCPAEFTLYSNMYKHFMHIHKLDKNADEYERLLKIVEAGKLAAAKKVSGYSIQCPVCAMSFPGQRVLRHMQMAHLEHPDFPQLIEVLHKKFLKLRNDHHAKSHTKNNGVDVCPHCGLTAKSSRLGNHIRYRCMANKNRRDLFCCSKCGFMSVFKEKYEAHIQSVHTGPKTNKYVCDICGNSYHSKGGFLQHHQRKHGQLNALSKPVKKHPCLICRKEFYTATHLLRHMPVHTGETPYKCDQCEKSYRDPSSLSAHTRTQHLNQYRFTCQHCGLGIDKKNLLALHLKKCPVLTAANTEEDVTMDKFKITPMDNSMEGTLIQIPDMLTPEGENVFMVIQQDDYAQAVLADGNNMEQVMSLLMNPMNSSVALNNDIIVQSNIE